MDKKDPVYEFWDTLYQKVIELEKKEARNETEVKSSLL